MSATFTWAFSRSLSAAVSHAFSVEANAAFRMASNCAAPVRVLWPAPAVVLNSCEYGKTLAGAPVSVLRLLGRAAASLLCYKAHTLTYM